MSLSHTRLCRALRQFLVGTGAIALSLAGAAPVAAQIEIAGDLFVELDAGDPTAGTGTWANTGILADFTAFGQPLATVINGAPAVRFNGIDDAYQCLEDTPAGLVGLDPTRSIEVWAFNESPIANEETLVSWGRRGGPDGTNMSFNYGTNQFFGAVGHWGAPDHGWADGTAVPVAGVWHHLVYTYDGTTTRVYSDGVEVSSEELGPGVINTHPEGRITLASQIEPDGVTLTPDLKGSLSLGRVRVHDGVLTPEQILSNFQLEEGDYSNPDIPPEITNLPGGLEDLHASDDPTYVKRIRVTGFPLPEPEQVVVSNPPGAVLTRLDTEFYLLRYDLPDPAPGSFEVEVQATNVAGTASEGWSVFVDDPVDRGDLVVRGLLYVELDAADPTAGTETWVNTGILNDFVSAGLAPVVVDQNGAPGVEFTGAEAYQSQEDAPDSLAGPDPERSIEAWVLNPEIADEETILSWGRRGGPDGTNMSFNYGLNAAFGAVGHWGAGPDLGWADGLLVPEAGIWHHLVYTYDGTTTRVYADGEEVSSEELGPGVINTHYGTKITLASQIEPDGVTLNGGLRGSLSLGRVRVHSGVLSAEDVLNNYEVEKDDFPLPDTLPNILNAPLEDRAAAGKTYVVDLTIRGRPAPFRVEVTEPAGASITPEGLLSYEVPDPGPETFTVTVEVENTIGTALASWLVTVITPAVLEAGPLHRYSFTEDAMDSVSGADGIPFGDVTFVEGQAVLANDGTQFSNDQGQSPPADPPGAYLDLPNFMISSLGNQATFEAWITWGGPVGSSWQRIFDFGTAFGGEDFSDGAGNEFYIFCTPRSGANTLRFGYRDGPPGVERFIDSARLETDTEQHVAVVWDGANLTARMYLNGFLVAEDTATHFALSDIADLNNWLGRSQFNDAMFNGSYNEFRIYDRALGEGEIAGNFFAGPDVVNTDGGPGDPVFKRGDVDGNGILEITDVVNDLAFQFLGQYTPTCLDAHDFDDNGLNEITDAVNSLGHQFLGDPPPPAPGTQTCGIDPTDDGLDCAAYTEEIGCAR